MEFPTSQLHNSQACVKVCQIELMCDLHSLHPRILLQVIGGSACAMLGLLSWTVRNFPVVTRLDVMYDLTGPIRFKNWS